MLDASGKTIAMIKNFKLAVLAGAAVILPLAAQAQTPEGAYVAIQGGVNFNMNEEASAGGLSGDVETDVGYAVGAATGYAFGNGFRTELEGTFRHNGVNDVSGFNGDGDLYSMAVMANVLYDIATGTDLYPYIGAGAGVDILTADVSTNLGGGMDGTDVGFGFQGIAGMGYNITDNWGATLDYRFYGAVGHDFDNVDYDQYYNHTVMVGLRYSFTKPEPAPAPVVQETVVQVPESYLVFFDWDSTAITPEAGSIISTAATNAKATGSAMLEVTGHADRSGTDSYNMGLSMRRAEAVMGELVANGIPRDDIAVYAKGESDPLVPTPDGVREPQNRRVVIVLN